MPILIGLVALAGLVAIGALLGLVCWALEGVLDAADRPADGEKLCRVIPIRPPTPKRQRQPGSLYARLLRASIEGPEDKP